MKSLRTAAVSLTQAVMETVFFRDGGRCIFCGRPGDPVMHFIPRSQGGLGIAENVATGCWQCHQRLDQSPERAVLLEQFRAYLDTFYPDFTDEQRRFSGHVQPENP